MGGGLGVRVLGGAALVLMGVIGLGVAMSSSWEAEASETIAAPMQDIMAYLDSPRGWREWTPWPDSVFPIEGPDRGRGAGMEWDDPELGDGFFVLTEVTPTGVRYHVEVNGGSMVTDGSIELAPDGTGTRMTWREEGDLGRNPLMGFWALSMDRAQTDELVKGVRRLGDLVTGHTGNEAPADSGSTGASD